jgi:hypothetical protein
MLGGGAVLNKVVLGSLARCAARDVSRRGRGDGGRCSWFETNATARRNGTHHMRTIPPRRPSASVTVHTTYLFELPGWRWTGCSGGWQWHTTNRLASLLKRRSGLLDLHAAAAVLSVLCALCSAAEPKKCQAGWRLTSAVFNQAIAWAGVDPPGRADGYV